MHSLSDEMDPRTHRGEKFSYCDAEMQLPNAKFAAITSCNVSLKLSTPENFFNQQCDETLPLYISSNQLGPSFWLVVAVSLRIADGIVAILVEVPLNKKDQSFLDSIVAILVEVFF